jgi:hypothetical protein
VEVGALWRLLERGKGANDAGKGAKICGCGTVGTLQCAPSKTRPFYGHISPMEKGANRKRYLALFHKGAKCPSLWEPARDRK